jgi:hypothetical protein
MNGCKSTMAELNRRYIADVLIGATYALSYIR